MSVTNDFLARDDAARVHSPIRMFSIPRAHSGTQEESANASGAKQYRPRRPNLSAIAVASALALNAAPSFAAGPFAYLASSANESHTVSVVDVSNPDAPPGTIAIEQQEDNTELWSVALSRADNMMYVSDDINETVYQVNLATGATVHQFVVGDNPRGIAVVPNGKFVFVAKFNGSGVERIDTVAGTHDDIDFGNIAGITSFPKPYDIVLNLAGTRAYVTDSSFNNLLCRIDIEAAIAVTPPPEVTADDCITASDNGAPDLNDLAINAEGTRVYAVDAAANTISVVDTTTSPMTLLNVFSLGVDGSGPTGITVNTAGTRAYVGTDLGKILPIDLTLADDPGANPVLPRVPDPDVLIGSVQGLSMSPDGTRLLAADDSKSLLHFVDVTMEPPAIVKSVPVNPSPRSRGQFIEVDPIFVAGFETSYR
jgi:DNA-binding beta-propeller fold protein YncE